MLSSTLVGRPSYGSDTSIIKIVIVAVNRIDIWIWMWWLPPMPCNMMWQVGLCASVILGAIPDGFNYSDTGARQRAVCISAYYLWQVWMPVGISIASHVCRCLWLHAHKRTVTTFSQSVGMIASMVLPSQKWYFPVYDFHELSPPALSSKRRSQNKPRYWMYIYYRPHHAEMGHDTWPNQSIIQSYAYHMNILYWLYGIDRCQATHNLKWHLACLWISYH